MSEILNIEYHRRLLTVKALNRAETRTGAANLLGISEKTLYRWIYIYEIGYNDKAKVYC